MSPGFPFVQFKDKLPYQNASNALANLAKRKRHEKHLYKQVGSN